MGLLLLLTIASARRAACLGPVPPARGLSLLRLRSGGGEAASPAGIWSLSAADLRIAGSAACGSYIQGYTTGVLGGSLLFLVPRFGLSPRAVGAVATATTLGSVVGTAAAARLADAAGRRRTMALSSLLFVAAGLLLCWTPGLGVLLAARFLGGVGVGACGAVELQRPGRARAPAAPPDRGAAGRARLRRRVRVAGEPRRAEHAARRRRRRRRRARRRPAAPAQAPAHDQLRRAHGDDRDARGRARGRRGPAAAARRALPGSTRARRSRIRRLLSRPVLARFG